MRWTVRELELLDPYGQPTGCFRRAAVMWLCDHEHDEGDPMCEDAVIEQSSLRARGLVT